MTYLITNYQPARPDRSLGQFSIHRLQKNTINQGDLNEGIT